MTVSALTTEAIVEQIRTIDVKALKMAASIARNMEARDVMSTEARWMADQLHALSDELKKRAPQIHRQNSSRISEGSLDLFFCQVDSGVLSLRLARLLQGARGDPD